MRTYEKDGRGFFSSYIEFANWTETPITVLIYNEEVKRLITLRGGFVFPDKDLYIQADIQGRGAHCHHSAASVHAVPQPP